MIQQFVSSAISSLSNLEECDSYRIDYRRFTYGYRTAHIRLILLVGAGRFERPTPCAQGMGRPGFANHNPLLFN